MKSERSSRTPTPTSISVPVTDTAKSWAIDAVGGRAAHLFNRGPDRIRVTFGVLDDIAPVLVPGIMMCVGCSTNSLSAVADPGGSAVLDAYILAA
jgi:hypothetical protein